jgi:glycosyltransferase involved in cell wall biosynthesis
MYLGRRVTVVIPAHNEALHIEDVLNGLPEFVDRAVVIDDASTDRTSAIVTRWKEERRDERIDLVRHEKNLGVGAAIKTGFKRALEQGTDIAVIMDGDDQMDPAQMHRLLDPIVQGKADYTKGNRLYARGSFKGMSNWRLIGNSMLTLLTKISSGNWHITDPQNGYVAITSEALERIDVDRIYPWYGYLNSMLARAGAYDVRVMDVPIPARYGNEKSKIRYMRYIRRVSWLLLSLFLWRMLVKYVARDFHPLVFFYLFSVPLILLGLAGGVFAIYDKVENGQPLFASAAAALMVFGLGTQFLFFAMYFDMNESKRLNGGA